MVLVSQFKKNIIANHTAQIVSVVSNFLCTIMLARMLGTFGQGELTLYNTFTSIVLLISGLGLPSAIVYFLASKKLNAQKTIPILLVISFISFSTLFLFFIFFKHLGFLNFVLPEFIQSNGLWQIVMFMQLLILGMGQFFQSVLVSENNFKKVSLITITGSFVLLFLYAIQFFQWIDMGISKIYWVISSLLFTAFIQFIFYWFQISKSKNNYLKFQSFNWLDIKPMLSFSALAYFANIIQFFNYKIDIWFLNFYHHNKEWIGIYSIGVALAQLVWLLPSATQSVLFTYVSSQENSLQEKMKKVIKTNQWVFLYALLSGIIGYFISIYIVPIFFGEAFSKSSQIIGILIIGIIPFSYSFGMSAYFAGTKKILINLYGSLIGLVVCVIGNIFLIPQYNIVGAAWASVISYIATLLFILYQFQIEKKNCFKK